MRCERCKRPLNAAAWSIQTKSGPLNFGPKCAKLAGYTRAESRRAARVVKPEHTKDESQLELELA